MEKCQLNWFKIRLYRLNHFNLLSGVVSDLCVCDFYSFCVICSAQQAQKCLEHLRHEIACFLFIP